MLSIKNVKVRRMKNSNLEIKNDCIQCGSCLGCGYDFLYSLDDGTVAVKSGTVLKKEIFNKLKEICPVDAFEFDSKVSKKTILLELKKKLEDFKGCLLPTVKDLPFNVDEYRIPIPVGSSSRYVYSSDREAERAALSEFERKMYSQIDNLILQVITEYRIKYVKPYYTKNENEGSVYAKINAEVNEIIDGIMNILAEKTPSNFSKINVFPDNDISWKMLNRGELLSDEMISAVKSQFDYSADSYSYKWDTDYTEVIVGKSLFGDFKCKEKYCYENLYDAYIELRKDLMNCFKWTKDRLEERAVEVTSWVVGEYNEELSEEINKRVEMLNKVLRNITD